jgi:hypothetical protein
MQRLEEVLRSSAIVAGSFMGTDTRPVQEVIDTDLAEIARLGYTVGQLAARMKELTELSIPRLGNWIDVDDKLKVVSQDYKGQIVCPWPHPAQLAKRVTTVRRRDRDESIRWTDLNIHMISEHRFFEGRGSAFRLEPKKLTSVIF